MTKKLDQGVFFWIIVSSKNPLYLREKEFIVIITIFMNLELERKFRRFVRNVKLRQRQTLLFLIYHRFIRKKK